MSEPTWALIAGGGTAGHLLPGLSVARALVAGGRDPSTIHFVGAERGPEQELVPASLGSFLQLLLEKSTSPVVGSRRRV